MSNNNNDKTVCYMQPDNMGICCTEPPGSDRCKKCGWNPAEANRRRNETERKIKEKESK